MEYRFVNRRANLEKIAEKIEQFFQERNFKTKKETMADEIHLVAMGRFVKEGAKRVEVIVSQKPDCLSVKFNTDKSALFSSSMSSMVSYLGGGLLVKRELESTEFCNKLEDEFWRNIEPIIPELSK